MAEFFIMLKNVIVFVALAVPGWLLAKKKLLKGEDCNVLTQLILYVAMPFLVFHSTVSIDFNGRVALELFLVAVITGVGQYVFSLLSGVIAKAEADGKQRGILRFAMVFGNNGFLGLPLVTALFSQSMPLVCTYFVSVGIVTNLTMMFVGDPLVSGEKAEVSLKSVLLSPLTISFALGIGANLSGVTEAVPEIENYAAYLKNLVTPLSMLIIGVKFGQLRVRELFLSKKLYFVALVRLILTPALVVVLLLLARLALPISDPLLIALFVGFAMPSGALTTSLAVKYNVPGNKATVYVLGTTLLSVITLPVMYFLLQLVL